MEVTRNRVCWWNCLAIAVCCCVGIVMGGSGSPLPIIIILQRCVHAVWIQMGRFLRRWHVIAVPAPEYWSGSTKLYLPHTFRRQFLWHSHIQQIIVLKVLCTAWNYTSNCSTKYKHFINHNLKSRIDFTSTTNDCNDHSSRVTTICVWPRKMRSGSSAQSNLKLWSKTVEFMHDGRAYGNVCHKKLGQMGS